MPRNSTTDSPLCYVSPTATTGVDQADHVTGLGRFGRVALLPEDLIPIRVTAAEARDDRSDSARFSSASRRQC